MTNRCIVVTGAHSYLGQKVLKHISGLDGFDIAALITPWTTVSGLINSPEIRYFKADLRENLSGEAAEAVRNADYVLHFAWVRGQNEEKVLNENLLMFENLKTHITSPEKLVFVSSVAASPETLSTYGRTKFKIANRLSEYGAVILVTGLIVDKDPRGPYKLLGNVVRKLPFSIRFTRNSVKVYPIRTDDFLNAIATVISRPVPAGTYRVYPAEAANINDFLAELERKYPRVRLRFPMSYKFSMSSLKFLRRIGLMPASLGEKLLTFLYKDEDYLARHKALPGEHVIDRPLGELI